MQMLHPLKLCTVEWYLLYYGKLVLESGRILMENVFKWEMLPFKTFGLNIIKLFTIPAPWLFKLDKVWIWPLVNARTKIVF